MSGEGEFSAIYASVESGKGEECYELDKVEIQRRQLLPPAPYLIPKPGNKGRRKPPGSSHQLERKYTTLRKTNRAADNQYASVSRTSKSSLKSSTSSSHSVHKLNTLMEEGDIDQETVPPTSLKAVHILLVVALLVSFVSTVMAVYTLASFESQRREHSMEIYSNCVRNVTNNTCHLTSTESYQASCSTGMESLDQEGYFTVSAHCEFEVSNQGQVTASLETSGSQPSGQCKCYLIPTFTSIVSSVATTGGVAQKLQPIDFTCSMVIMRCPKEQKFGAVVHVHH